MENRVFYLALGDSLTEGVGASAHDKSFTSLFFDAIKQTIECEYMNYGKSARCSGELLEFLTDSKIRDLLKRATHITITTGGNDMIRAYRNNATFLEYVRTVRSLEQNLKRILQNITETNPNSKIFLMGLYNPGHTDHSLYNMANLLIQKINKVYEETAKHFRVETINPMGSFLNKPHLLADEVHPNDLGYKVLANLFLNKYRSISNL
ncbi:lysophospholipase L1-like esterase [Bacillus oleivorans]|uniref:Lysophospholipase L1-like esterase n=1 Tax=Bacillus oleivorans TaxID=1448271 RepID=A0A285CYV8_9BACI|nr:GDSL-type esterase/lipase family protein [Bacillus oleivorans]SNX72754.1 lysophospholipase L1-like esterase [Bacillus oleivorans]